jgi:nitrite reductase/ring-hydroxylating ferredoxin subunit
MLHISYVKIIPYPFEVILDQYFDYEHVAHVHPRTLGEYMLVENRGNEVVYDQRWPADRRGQRAVSRVTQTYRPPGDIWFEFTAGKHRGTKVHTQLKPHTQGTEVAETYQIPGLPNWRLLSWLIGPFVMRQVERIWDEDLRVGVCIGGWPGIPGRSRQPGTEERRPLPPGTYHLGPVEKFPPGSLTTVATPAGTVLVAHTMPPGNEFRAMHPNCPHTGGPLAWGSMADGCVVCPWHAARFDMTTGRACGGPTRIPLRVYATSVMNGELVAVVEQ